MRYSALLCLAIAVLSACTKPTKIDATTEVELPVEEQIETKDPKLEKVKNLLATDVSLNSLLLTTERVVTEQTKFITTVSDSVGVYIAPLQDESSTHYIMFTTDGKSIRSLTKLSNTWVENDEKEFPKHFRFLSDPLIYKEDITNDGIPELVVKDRQSVGTFNAAAKHFFKLSADNIQYFGSFQSILHLHVENKYLVRHWDTKTELVEVYLKDNLKSDDSTLVGTYTMSAQNGTIKLSDLNTVMPEYEKLILPSKRK